MSLAVKSRFPETETAAGRDRFDRRALLGGEAQNLVLARPFGWQIAKTDDAHTVGIRLAVGARRGDILWQFLLEAIGLSIVGGVAGVVVGFIVSLMIARLASWSLIVDPRSVALAVTSSVLVGVFFGWYPAFRASRLEPIEAIRTV